MEDFPKKYDPSRESQIYQQWIDAGCFLPETQRATKGEFVIPMPPPNVTGILHLGHALMNAVQDTMVRHARMQNKRTLRVPGTDHAGIATQVKVEQKLMQDEKKTKDEIGREAFMAKLRDRVHTSKDTIISQTKTIWASADWSREQFSMSEQLSRSVRKAFVTLYNKKRIYKDAYMVNRSPEAKTVLSDLEVDHKDVEGKMYYIKYFVDGKGDCITVATVRPETMFADVAVAVHPKDKRYKKRIGKNVLIPIINKSIPVIADEEVQMDMGTGALKITPTHSETDYHIAWRHNLPMDNFAFDKQGNFTELAGEMLAWQSIVDFEENLVHHLAEIDNLDKIEDHTHKVPYCSRTGCRVQPFLSTQWFMDVVPATQQIMTRLEEDQMQIHPTRFKKTFTDWLENIKPRCISRQLRRWHRIPVRYDQSEKKYVFDEDNVLQDTKGKKTALSLMIFNLIADSRLTNPFNIEDLIEVVLSPALVNQYDSVGHAYLDMYRTKFANKKMINKELDEIQAFLDGVLKEYKQTKRMTDKIIAWAEKLIDMLEKSANIQAKGDWYKFLLLPDQPDLVLTQDSDVLDTWFSSGLRPFSTLWRPDQTKDLKKFYPNTVLETWYDIIFFWVIRMMIMGVELTDQLPFEHVYLHGMVRDAKGKKMSKSVGNAIDPVQMIQEHGADAVRWSLLMGNTPGTDLKYSEEKVIHMKKFVNKIWNASRYVLTQVDPKLLKNLDYEKLNTQVIKSSKKMNDYDAWIYGKVQDLILQVGRYNEKFMIGESLQEIIDVVRHDFCDRYIEISKIETSEVSHKVLLYCLTTFYKLLHPSLPFVTEQLWQHIWCTDILMMSARPTAQDIPNKDYKMNLLMDMISQWRKIKRNVTNKPHESVDIYVQWSNDIHAMVKEHFGLVQDIIKVKEIHYLELNAELEWDRESGMVMDIKVWLKGIKEINKKEKLQALEQELAQEQQFLQRLRGMLSGDFASRAPADVVEEKKKKLEEMKNKVASLEAEIRKLKM